MSLAGPPLSKRELKKYDGDGDGQLDMAEFQLYCFQKGHLITAPELMRAFQQIDRDASGQVDTDEFTAWFRERERWASLNIVDRSVHAQCFMDCASFNSEDATIMAADVPVLHAALTANALTDKPLAALEALMVYYGTTRSLGCLFDVQNGMRRRHASSHYSSAAK